MAGLLLAAEIQRCELYTRIRRGLAARLVTARPSPGEFNNKVDMMLVRYLFNRLATYNPEDGPGDPVFVHTTSGLPGAQLRVDLGAMKVTLIGSSTDIVQWLHDEFEKAAKAMVTLIKDTVPATAAKIHDKLIYDPTQHAILLNGKMMVPNCEALATRYPKALEHIAAASLRYKYLCVGGQGLAVNYAKLGLKRDQGTEAFASVFNRYFDHFCTAFPDLENALGASGSFFHRSEPHNTWPTRDVYVNPPFDETVCRMAVQKFLDDALDADTPLRIHFILPAWDNFEAQRLLKAVGSAVQVTKYARGKLDFVSLTSPKPAHPCDIVWSTLRVGPMDKAETFYNQKSKRKRETKEEMTTADRDDDRHRLVRNLLNRNKAEMLQAYAATLPAGSTQRVLEYGCGQGQDVRKVWRGLAGRLTHIDYVDISDESMSTCKERLLQEQRSQPKVVARSFVLDFNDTKAVDAQLPVSAPKYNLILAQLCIHYAFGTEEAASAFLGQVKARLAPGGVFMGITVDADAMRAYLPQSTKALFSVSPIANTRGYHMRIGSLVDCDEYLVDPSEFMLLAADHQLEVQFTPIEHLDTLRTTHPDQWELASLYTAFRVTHAK